MAKTTDVLLNFPKHKIIREPTGSNFRLERIEKLIDELKYEIFKGLNFDEISSPIFFQQCWPSKDGFYRFTLDVHKTKFPLG